MVNDTDTSDASLLMRLSRGDRAAWSVLAVRYFDTVSSVTSRVLGRSFDAEDADQQTLLRLQKCAHKFDRDRYGNDARCWIAMIAYREALIIARRRARCRFVPTGAYDLFSGDADVLSRLEERELITSLRGAINALPYRQREAILKSFDAELTQVQIASEADCDQSTVSDRIRRGLKTLKQRLGVIGQSKRDTPVEKCGTHRSQWC
jgi:RNA polymerase sigma-70 factor, ECF subfamily